MKRPSPATLSGRHVRLEPLRLEHAEALLAASDPRIWEFALAPMETLEDVRSYVETALAGQAEGAALPFVQVSSDSGQVVGSTRFGNISVPDSRVEIGWTWIHPAFWGSQINAEAKYLLLRHAFEDLGALRVEFKGDALNMRSRRALEKLGASFEGILRQHMRTAAGRQRDSFYYSIIAAEWPGIKSRLEARLEDGCTVAGKIAP